MFYCVLGREYRTWPPLRPLGPSSGQEGQKKSCNCFFYFYYYVNLISILKSRESIFSGIFFSTHLKQDLIDLNHIIHLVTLLFTFAMLQQKACHSFSAYHGGDTVNKSKAIYVICNAQVTCYSNTINQRKHLRSHIRRHDFCNKCMADGVSHCFVYYTHTKARTTLEMFSASAVSIYDDMTTWISSSAALSHFTV